MLERVWPVQRQVRDGTRLSRTRPSVRGSPNTMSVGAGTPASEEQHGIPLSSPPPPPPVERGGGGERDGDGVEVAEVGDDHKGGLPPHPLLLLLLPLVLLPLAQSHRWQAMCHTGRPGIGSEYHQGQRE